MKRILSLFLLALSLTAFAQRNTDKAGYRILLDSTSVSVKPSGSGTFNIVQAIKINTSAGGVAHRTIVYDYDPLTAFAVFKYVTICRADGNVEYLDVSKAYDYVAPARAIYWGARQIMFEVGRLNPGDVLKYEIEKKGFTYALLSEGFEGADAIGGAGAGTIAGIGYGAIGGAGAGAIGGADEDESRFIPPMRGEFYDIVPFWVTAPTDRKVYQISIPMEKEIQFQFYQGECTSSMRYQDGRKIYKFYITDAVPVVREQGMVDLYDAAPKLMLSSTKNWEAKSLWFNGVNEAYGSFEAYEPAQKKVNEIIKGKTDEMDKIAALTHWVADNIRYAGLTMGKGEGFTLHNQKMNFTDRCGVCKDIASTLIGFLRMAGFEAYPAMTMAGSRVESIPADHFNHCVAVVKLSSGVYMPLDPTWVPFCRELWSSAEQQQNYLPGIPEGSDIRKTPVSAPENHYFRIKANNTLTEEGTLKGEFTVSAEGQSDSRVRGVFNRMEKKEWYNNLEKELLAVSPKAKIIKVEYGKDPRDYQAAPISITYKYIIPDYAIKGENEMLFKPLVMSNIYASVRTYNRLNTAIEKRNFGFSDACSRLVEFEEVTTIPTGYSMIGDAKSSSSQSPAADFNGELHQDGNTITLLQKLSLKKRVYEPEDWDGFREAVTKHQEYGNYIIIKK